MNKFITLQYRAKFWAESSTAASLPLRRGRYRSLFRLTAVAYATAQAASSPPLCCFLFLVGLTPFFLTVGRVSESWWNNYTTKGRNARKSPQMHSNASNHQTGEKHKREMGFAHSQETPAGS